MKAIDRDGVLYVITAERSFIETAKEIFGDNPLFANYQSSANVVLKSLAKIEKQIRMLPSYEFTEPDDE